MLLLMSMLYFLLPAAFAIWLDVVASAMANRQIFHKKCHLSRHVITEELHTYVLLKNPTPTVVFPCSEVCGSSISLVTVLLIDWKSTLPNCSYDSNKIF